jgi:hypothetical protein
MLNISYRPFFMSIQKVINTLTDTSCVKPRCGDKVHVLIYCIRTECNRASTLVKLFSSQQHSIGVSSCANWYTSIYILLSYYKRGFMCVCLSVCLCVRLYISTVLNGSSPNVQGTFYGSWHVPWAIYVVIDSGAFIVTVYWTVMSTPNGWTDSLKICWERTTTHHKC